MKTSESILKISPAIVKAQGAITTVTKDAANSFFKKADGSFAQYATLDSIIEAIKTPLLQNELSVIQVPTETDGKNVVITRILHSSGEFFEISTQLFLKNQDMQSFGSAITYAKRYALGSFFNIATETDDDGNGATGKPKDNPTAAKKPESKPETKQERPIETDYTKYKMKVKTKNKAEIGQTFAQLGAERVDAIGAAILKKDKDSRTVDESEFLNLSIEFLKATNNHPPGIDSNEEIPF